MSSSSFGIVNSNLLEKIDGLFSCNVGNYIDLPQLVVVGNQSSGKSSVLAGLTGLPFPVDKELCTRFATQITFRRGERSAVNVSIIPAKDTSSERRDQMHTWGKRELKRLDSATFVSIMAEVMNVMGLLSGDELHRQAFSKDVLVIEVTGPNEEHFSIIDVPGVFRNTTLGVTTKEDIDLVNQMVHQYMVNPRSVMLTVVPCNVDIATEDITQRAEDLDPSGDRTLGILTKPDLVDPGAEGTVVDLIEGKRQRLKLGWHVLRNPGQAQINDKTKTRQQTEDLFFKTKSPWNSLDKRKTGIGFLRIRLQEILASHIRKEFPEVKSEINTRLKVVETALKALGARRENEFEQRAFLMDIATKFQDISSCAIRTDYGRHRFFDVDSRRLVTAAVNRGQLFAEQMQSYGHEIHFKTTSGIGDIAVNDTNNQQEIVFEKLNLDESASLPSRCFPDVSDISHVVAENVNLSYPRDDDMISWLRSVHQRSRGFEIGTFDSTLLATTMRSQACKWNDFALGYVSDVITTVHQFIDHLLAYILPHDDQVKLSIASLLSDRLRDQYEKALQHTHFLLLVELGGTPATYNHYFKDNLDKSRQKRLQSQLAGRSFSDGCHGSVIRVEDLVQNHPLSNDNHIVLEIHDILKSYYKLSRKRFVDNVRMQVVDHFLLTGPENPLKLFSPKFIATISSDQLEHIAGEEPRSKRQRAELEKEMNHLKDGRKILS